MAWEKQLLAEQGRIVELSDDVAEIVERAMAAERTADAAPDVKSRNTEAYLEDDAYLKIWPGYSEYSRARKLAQEGREPEALELYARIYQAAQQVQGFGQMIEARSSQALIYQAQGKLERALEALEDGLRLSEPEGYVRTYADRGAPMAQLLREAAARGVKPDYTAKLLAAFGGGTADGGRQTNDGRRTTDDGPTFIARCVASAGRTTEPSRARGAAIGGPGPLESRDRSAVVPGLEHGQGAQSEHLWQAAGHQPHAGGGARASWACCSADTGHPL